MTTEQQCSAALKLRDLSDFYWLVSGDLSSEVLDDLRNRGPGSIIQYPANKPFSIIQAGSNDPIPEMLGCIAGWIGDES
jgi:hypothetical protein